MKIGFFDQSWIDKQRKNANPKKFTKALAEFLAIVANPFGNSPSNHPVDEDPEEIECCICINAIAPYQALFISPCSHIYHHKCVASMIAKSPMFLCPLCRQVANLTASVSSGDICGTSNMPLSDILVVKEEQHRNVTSINTPTHPPTFAEINAVLEPIAAESQEQQADASHNSMANQPKKRGIIQNILRRLSLTPSTDAELSGNRINLN